MEKIELFDLIESYLDGTLSKEKQREVERRMLEDVAFRREVELHRGLQENYSDPGRWRLRNALTHAMNEPLPSNDPVLPPNASLPNHRVKWIILIGIVLVGIMIWYWFQSPRGAVDRDPPQIQPVVPVPEMKTDTILPATPKTLPSRQQSEERLLLAEANPANFVPNSSMEALVSSGLRGYDDLTLQMISPSNEATITPDKKGASIVHFEGYLQVVSEESPNALDLIIFNNKDVITPMISMPLELKKDETGLNFDKSLRVDYVPGLYYFSIELQGEMLYAGKFTIGKLKK